MARKPKAVEPVHTAPVVTNCLAGTLLSLGDGRTLGFGESATVTADLAKFLRDRGQAK